MRESKFIGWTAFGLFIAAAALMVLFVFFPILAKYELLNPQAAMVSGTALPTLYQLIYEILQPRAAIVVSGILAFVATILGFAALKTSQGKVGAMGGLVLVLAVAVLLSFATITGVERSSVPPPQLIVQPAEP